MRNARKVRFPENQQTTKMNGFIIVGGIIVILIVFLVIRKIRENNNPYSSSSYSSGGIVGKAFSRVQSVGACCTKGIGKMFRGGA